MWKCKTCGETHEDQFEACWKCDTRRDEPEVESPRQTPRKRGQRSQRKRKIDCQACGTSLPDGAIFCLKCGVPVSPPESAPQRVQTENDAVAEESQGELLIDPDRMTVLVSKTANKRKRETATQVALSQPVTPLGTNAVNLDNASVGTTNYWGSGCLVYGVIVLLTYWIGGLSNFLALLWIVGLVVGLALLFQKKYLGEAAKTGCGAAILMGWWAIPVGLLVGPLVWAVALFLPSRMVCPSCKAVIPSDAKRCAYCQAEVVPLAAPS